MSRYSDPLKIHLAKVKDSLEPACFVKPSFCGKVVANDHSKVTCFHCLKIIESTKRAIKFEDYLNLGDSVNFGKC